MADESAFRAIAHPVRRRMLDMLRRRELAVSELVQPFRLSRPSISQHLRVLRTSGLVTQRRRGRTRVYALDAPRLRAIFEWISEYQPAWVR
jgi:DNA-binding transcriptional ArsR family regulator